jgi:hypothetical protein
MKDLRARVEQLESQARKPVVQDKADLVLVALQLFLRAHIGFRAVSRVLALLSGFLGIRKAPCPQTVVNWVTRLSMARIRSASTLKGSPMPRAPFCNGLVWMIDASIGLGSGKILAVVAVDAHHHQHVRGAPGFRHVHCLAVSVAGSWTGESVARLLRRLVAVMGRPAAYLKDGGADLRKAVRLLDEEGLGSPAIADISHEIANILKWWYHDHPRFESFLSACGHVSGKIKQTILACLAPPKIQTKARFMNLHRLVAWADRLLKLSPVGRAKKGSVLEKLRACLDSLPEHRAFVERFRKDAEALLACQKILKNEGLGHDTAAQCRPIIERMATADIRREFNNYLQEQLRTAVQLGLDKTGMPIASDQIESLFGVAKQHGMGAVKDADRIALRLPALCGDPTRAEAERVLQIGVAEQNELTRHFSSLTKLRRQVLPRPERLEMLETARRDAHVELVPGAENRSNIENSEAITDDYDDRAGPVAELQSEACCPSNACFTEHA